MLQIAYLSLIGLLLIFAYIVFRIIVRHDYAVRGKLGVISSSLQLLVFAMFFAFPYLFNPPEWGWFWMMGDSSSRGLRLAGLLLICSGFVVAFGIMIWFGIGRAFGLHTRGLVKVGPYRISRNPQILGGYLLLMGTTLQTPSLYMVGWMLSYVLIAHWMVTTEEENLHQIYGEEYEAYCSEVPRYLFI